MTTNTNTQALQKALDSFKEVLLKKEALNKNAKDAKDDKALQDIFRDSSLQRFEYAYELSWKLIQKVLIEQYGITDIIQKPKKDLFREAKRRGLIDDINSWFKYHSARNSTAHIYDENMANDILKDIKDFDSRVEFALNKINDLIK